MQEGWIKTLGKMTYGIYVLTSFHKKEVNGMIASWVSQISYDPLLIMAAVHPNRYSHQLIEKSGCFALFLGEVVDAHSFTEGTPFSSMDYNGVYLGKE